MIETEHDSTKDESTRNPSNRPITLIIWGAFFYKLTQYYLVYIYKNKLIEKKTFDFYVILLGVST